ncbi:HIT family protein [Candidatus Nomurabacteria bacterium]|nr:MAG: HIT family protein [Candidatus Nomurabacteria bacterium]
MESCIFCKIIKGEIPCTKVYEDEVGLAFLDVNPINPGHTLLIPKEHHENIHEMPDELLEKLMPTAKKIANAIKFSIGATGINIGQNNGTDAGQVIWHYHMHIIPRFAGDGLKHWPGKPYMLGEAEETAEKIKSVL